jgi:carbon-monoxide dehydrogenase medium subunit
MIPGRFSYDVPDSATAVVDVLSRDPQGTVIIGGGTWVIPEMNHARRKPRRVVDLRRAGLSEITSEGDRIRIGAMCTYAQLLESELIDQHLELLSKVAAGITGGRQIVAQGTIGGSLCAARPQSDIPAALMAIGARAIVAGYQWRTPDRAQRLLHRRDAHDS